MEKELNKFEQIRAAEEVDLHLKVSLENIFIDIEIRVFIAKVK